MLRLAAAEQSSSRRAPPSCPEPEFRARSAQFFFINFVICPPNFEKFSLKIYGVTGFDARLETQKFLEICPQKGRAAANRTVERCCCRVRSQVHMRYECVRAEALLHSMRRPKLSRTLALRCRSQVPRSAVAGRARSQNTHRYRTLGGRGAREVTKHSPVPYAGRPCAHRAQPSVCMRARHVPVHLHP